MSVRMPFFIPAHPTMTKRSTSNKCNHNKATVKKKPYRYSIADRVLQRCIKLNHITPFDCVTDEAPHRQIPYERRPFRGVRVFQISQDSLDYFLVAIQYLRKVVAIEHSEQVLDISPSGVIRFLGPAFIEHLLSVLHRPSSLGPVGVKHLVSGFPSQLLGTWLLRPFIKAATKFGSILFPPIKLANIPGIIDNKPLVALPLPEPIPSNKTILSPLVPMSIYF